MRQPLTSDFTSRQFVTFRITLRCPADIPRTCPYLVELSSAARVGSKNGHRFGQLVRRTAMSVPEMTGTRRAIGVRTYHAASVM
jgi:hypothetical protein